MNEPIPSFVPPLAFDRTVAEIYPLAVRKNYCTVSSLTQKTLSGMQVGAVVKADAYGHGVQICVPALLAEGCRFFCVATIREGVAVREICNRSGVPEACILILGYTPVSLVSVLEEYRLSQSLLSPAYALELGISAHEQKRQIFVHIALDTGMNRIGFASQDTRQMADSEQQILSFFERFPLIPEGIFSHYARADEVSSEALRSTLSQNIRFTSVCRMLAKKGLEFPMRHLSASAGIGIPCPEVTHVRAGIALYGVRPTSEFPSLSPTLVWKAKIVHLHRVKKGSCIGYGGDYVAPRDTCIATLAVGYGDGFLRGYRKSTVRIYNADGAWDVPIVGRICMDMCMAEVGDLPVQVGDTAVLTENEEDLIRLARSADTIPYEVLCAISGRVPRISCEGDACDCITCDGTNAPAPCRQKWQ